MASPSMGPSGFVLAGLSAFVLLSGGIVLLSARIPRRVSLPFGIIGLISPVAALGLFIFLGFSAFTHALHSESDALGIVALSLLVLILGPVFSISAIVTSYGSSLARDVTAFTGGILGAVFTFPLLVILSISVTTGLWFSI